MYLLDFFRKKVFPFSSIFSNSREIESKYIVCFYPETVQNLMRIKWLLEKSKPESKKYSENNNESTAELFRKVVGIAYTILFYSSDEYKVIIEKRRRKAINGKEV